MKEQQLIRTVFVKAVENDDGEWLLDVLGVPFDGPYDGKDSDGEYFDQNTELWLDKIGKRAIVQYHGWDPETGKPIEKPEVIGEELGYEIKADGVWFKVALDKTKEDAAHLWKVAKLGLLRASTGALRHLARINEKTGHIVVWPAAELSLVDMTKGNIPINPYAVALPALRSVFKAAKLDLPLQFNESPQPQQVEREEPDREMEANKTMTEQVKEVVKEVKGLTVEDVLALMEKRDAEKAEKARVAELEKKAARLDELEDQVKALKEAQSGREQVKKLPHPEPDETKQPQIEVFSKWDGFSVGQLGLAYEMLKAVNAPQSGTLYRALHAKALKTDLYVNQLMRNSRGEVIREFNPNVNSRAMAAVKARRPMQEAVKSDELHGSDVTDAGDEWVPAYWTPELWDLVRNEAMVLSRFRQVEVPGESLTIPTLEGKTTVYKVAQTDSQSELDLPNAAATMSKATTGNVTLTPVKGMAWLGFTEELNEDSIVPVLTTMQSVLARDLAEQIDEILISGDTDTTNANNSDTGNGSIATTWRILIADGLRDYALENSKTSEVGALTAEDFTAVMAKVGTNGAFALNPDRLIWVMDPGVYRKALLLGETLTADKAGGVGTFQNGRLQMIFGSDVIVSDKYALTDANGQIHNTAGNNTYGSFLLVRPDRWVVGFGRQVRIEVPARDITQIVTDTRHLIASFRMDFKYHSGGNGAALGYAVTV